MDYPSGVCDSFANFYLWYSPTKNGTPDYFHAINDLICPITGFQNNFGIQTPMIGNGYAHFATYVNDLHYSFREYLQIKLSSSLISGSRYCLSFYLSITDSSDYVADMFGAYFSIDSFYFQPLTNLPYIPQLENCTNCFYETRNQWQRFSGSFIADGGEQYLTIGNFRSDSNTNFKWIPNGPHYHNGECSFYIDSVSVVECPLPPPPPPPPVEKENKVYIPNIFSPNGDGKNDLFFIRGENIENYSLKICNRWGEFVFETQDKNTAWDGQYKGKRCPSGAYVYKGIVWYKDGETEEVKGSVTIIR